MTKAKYREQIGRGPNAPGWAKDHTAEVVEDDEDEQPEKQPTVKEEQEKAQARAITG